MLSLRASIDLNSFPYQTNLFTAISFYENTRTHSIRSLMASNGFCHLYTADQYTIYNKFKLISKISL